MKIQDNGLGMNVSDVDQSQHFGLLGIRERVQGFHGQFNVVSQTGAGTAIEISLPIS